MTNAPVLNATHMLDVLGLTERFTVKVTIEQVERGKPDPLPYLTALGGWESLRSKPSPSRIRPPA